MNFFAQYPSLASASGSGASTGLNGQPAPIFSTEVGGINPSGDLQPLQTDADGNLKVAITNTSPSPLPVTDAAAEASLASIDSKTPALVSGRVPVDGSGVTQPISAVSLPLPSGAATSANQLLTQGPVAAGAAAAKSDLVGAVYNAILPTLTDTQQAALQVDSSGRLITAPSTSTSVVTANQGTANTSANGWPVKVTDGTTDVPVKAASTAAVATDPAFVVAISPNNTPVLPSGAATSANQTSEITELTTLNTNMTAVQGPVAAGTAATKSDLVGGVYNTSLPTLANTQQAAMQLDASGRLIVSPLASTSTVTANQGTANTAANGWPVKVTDGTTDVAIKAASTAPVAADPAFVVAISPNTPAIASKVAGSAAANAPVYNIYSSTPISTSAYTQLVASTTSATNSLHIFDSSGQAMILATGGPGSEVIQAYIQPGGDILNLAIPAGTRVAYKALTANASSGYLLVDFFT